MGDTVFEFVCLLQCVCGAVGAVDMQVCGTRPVWTAASSSGATAGRASSPPTLRAQRTTQSVASLWWVEQSTRGHCHVR